MQEFANHLKEAGESAREEADKSESLTSISLAISILAVLVAMVTVVGHRTHTRAVLMQGRAGDQWNLYQAKKIRSDNLNVTVDVLGLEKPVSPELNAKLEEYRAHLAKWKQDLAEEQRTAREYEEQVERAEHQASRYDLGEALLQISVVLSSVTLFTRRRSYFLLGLTMGAVGVVVSASALLLH